MRCNNKGFTLIEMLVVIAIISILVAIVLPTAMAPGNRAACATNAANLRAIQGEVSIAAVTVDPNFTFDSAGNCTIRPEYLATLPKSKKTTEPVCEADLTVSVYLIDGQYIAKFGDLDAADFLDYAAGAEAK